MSLESIPNLALRPKTDPFRVAIRSGFSGVTVVTAEEPGRVDAGMGGFEARLEVRDRFFEQNSG